MDQTSDGRYRYDIYLDEDVHWALVALGARNKMHQEDYAEEVLTEYVALALRRETAANTLQETDDDSLGEQTED